MTIYRKGLFIQLINRHTSSVIFSAMTDELSQEAFDVLGSAIGKSLFKGLSDDKDLHMEYELYLTPVTG